MKTRKRERLAASVCMAALLAALFLTTRLLTPQRHDSGSTWGQYLREVPDSTDVLFFGSSLVYCDVVPAVIWEESGLRSYVMAGPEQTIPMTYHYVRQALKTQSPKAVFVEITGLFYTRYTSYTKINIGYMPWGAERLKATFAEAEPELRGGLLFPLYFYHSRWSTLKGDDFRTAAGGYGRDPLAGYTFLNQFCRTEGFYERSFPDDDENLERNLAYLEKINTLCRKRNITPVFYVAPALGRIPADRMDAVRSRVGSMDGAVLLDCNASYGTLGIDERTDYFDTLHFNSAGADKFSRWLAAWTTRNLALSPGAGADTALWQSRAAWFHELSSRGLTPKKAE